MARICQVDLQLYMKYMYVCVCMPADSFPSHKNTICGVGWDVNVRWHLLHEVDATLGMGLGGVGWDVDVREWTQTCTAVEVPSSLSMAMGAYRQRHL